MGTEKHMNLRKEIQALRALAVMAVFVYHLRPAALTGGFVQASAPVPSLLVFALIKRALVAGIYFSSSIGLQGLQGHS